MRSFLARLVVLPVGLVLGMASAHAQQTIFGWQLGVVETVGSTFTTDDLQFMRENEFIPLTREFRSLGMQLNTQLTANVTLDLISPRFEQGLLLGGGFTLLQPTLVPSNALPVVAERNSGFTANARYLARWNRARWNLQLGAEYGYSSFSQLALRRGAVDVGQNTRPAGFVSNGSRDTDQHTASARGLYQLTRARWDLDLGGTYTYSSNAQITVAPAAVAEGAGGALAAPIVDATTHTLAPTLDYRQRIGARHQLNFNAGHVWTVPAREPLTQEEILRRLMEQQAQQNSGLIIFAVIPETAQSTVGGQYLYNLTPERSYGFTANGTLGLRRPMDFQTGLAYLDTDGLERGLTLDTLIFTAQAVYNDRLRWGDTRISISAGVAQARLYQPPLGGASSNFPFYTDAVVAPIEPIGALTIQRLFDPVDVTLNVGRTVGVGALGASATISENAALTFRHLWDLGATTQIVTTVGINGSINRGAGQELLPVNPEVNSAPSLDSTNIGAGGEVQIPIFRDAGFTVDTTLSYNYLHSELDTVGAIVNPNDPDPMLDRNIAAHTAFLSVRGTWGRGPLENAGDDMGELDAFSADPSTGSPLTSARLMNQRAALSQGTRGSAPGLPPAVRRDSQQAYQVERLREGAEREQRLMSGGEAGQAGGGTFEQDAAAAAAAAALEAERRRGSREPAPVFDEIPEEDLVVPLTRSGTAAATIPWTTQPVAPEETKPAEAEPDAAKKPEKKASKSRSRGKKASRKKADPEEDEDEDAEVEVERF